MKKVFNILSGKKTGKGVVLGGKEEKKEQGEAKETPREKAAQAAFNRLEKNTCDSKMDSKTTTYSEPQAKAKACEIDQSLYECPLCQSPHPLNLLKTHFKECYHNKGIEDINTMVSAMFTFTNSQIIPDGVTVLTKYLENIIQNPTDMKFRRIRKNNKQFSDKVSRMDYAVDILNYIGFIETEEAKPNGETDFFYILPEHADFDKLNQVKTLIESQPKLSFEFFRDITSYSAKNKPQKLIEDSDKDYELTPDDLKIAYDAGRKQIEEAAELKSKHPEKSGKKFNYGRIRVRFPDDSYLEASFLPSETLACLYKVVRSNLVDSNVPFELFESGLNVKKISENDIKIDQTNLFPRSLLILKPVTSSSSLLPTLKLN